ncbi:MAG: PPC domain-containing protein [Solirubrobacteraceae bacterium]
MRRLPLALLLCTVAALLPAAAQAAPPANDNRATATPLTLPAAPSGTTSESTLEEDEPSSCAQLRGSVWYSVQAPARRNVVVRLAAQGDLDAVVDVFQRTRSQLSPVNCDVGNARGQAETEFRSTRGGSYLIRVGQRVNSVPGGFRLDVFAPQPPPKPPGPALPAAGVSRSVNVTGHTSDAFSTVMRAGTTYRVHRAQARGCTALALYPPGTTDFDEGSPVKRAGCGGYFLFTPAAGEGGRYSLLVTAQPRRRGDQRYHLQVAQATDDDTSPGLPLANYERARGSLQGSGVDAVDIYRFSLARRSLLRVNLSGNGFKLQLLRDTGHRVASSDDGVIERRVKPGRYYLAVRSPRTQSGRYVLQRAARTITHARISIDGEHSAGASPGAAVRVGVRLRPPVAGPVRITLERFDPFAGWQFYRRVSVQAGNGVATLSFTPPSQGRWRASAVYRGTRLAAPSETGYATVLVAPPLSD